MSCLPLFSGLIYSQYIEIRAELDTNQITIGDQFNLDLYVNQPVEMKIRFPGINDTLTGKIEVLQQYDIDTSVLGNRLELHRRYLLTCFDSGFYQIPSLPFILSFNNRNDTLYSKSTYLAVNTVPLDPDIRDIKQPIPVPVSLMEVLPYILLGLLAIGIIYGTIYFLRKRKRKEPLFSISKPQYPPHLIALRELDELKEAKLWQRNEYKLYYTRLTEIIRTYIEKRYEIPAMEQTSFEILSSWKISGIYNGELFEILVQLLNLADLVKFAKEKPLPSDNDINMDNAYRFVRKTVPVFPEQEKNITEEQEPEKVITNE